PIEQVQSLAAREKAPLLDTLKALVSIESGSQDREGLDRLSALIADRLKALGGQVELVEPDPADIYRMVDTPKQIGRMVLARFTGTGTKKILLIAHMDTVYHRGMLAQQPFRIDGSRAYGLAIADDKQRNALYELAHQIMQMRDLSDPATGLKMNWTLANAGDNRNVIPAKASAVADVRVRRIADYDGIEQKVRERIRNQLIPDTKVEMTF